MANSHISDEKSKEINNPNYIYTCKKCNIPKPNYEFSRDNANKKKGRRYVTQCKKCRILYSKTEKGKESKKITRVTQSKKHRINIIFHSSKGNARKKNIEHSITIDYLEKLWNEQKGLCYYTDKEMLRNLLNSENNNDSVSIDRIDSSKGYIEGNVVLCRWIVNRMKNDIDLEQFLNLVSEINKKFN